MRVSNHIIPPSDHLHGCGESGRRRSRRGRRARGGARGGGRGNRGRGGRGNRLLSRDVSHPRPRQRILHFRVERHSTFCAGAGVPIAADLRACACPRRRARGGCGGRRGLRCDRA